jgi:hypothetical protein
MAMTAEDRLAQAPAVLARRSLGSVLARLPEGPLHTLTGTAADVWELLGREPTAREVAGALAARYDAPAGDILADVTTLLSTLADAGLVVAHPGAPAGTALA